MLTEIIKIRVRFSEVDTLGIVWHGRYLAYMEDAREAFGKKYGLEYITMFNNNSFAPIIDMNLKYKHAATLDDELFVKVTYLPKRGGRMYFDYEIRNAKNDQLVLTASSIQLFTDKQGKLDPMPEWFEQWKVKNNVKV